MTSNADIPVEWGRFDEAMRATKTLIRLMVAPILHELMRRRRLGIWSSPSDDRLALMLYAYTNDNFEIAPMRQLAREQNEYALSQLEDYPSRKKAAAMCRHLLAVADKLDREELGELFRLYPLGDNDGGAASTT